MLPLWAWAVPVATTGTMAVANAAAASFVPNRRLFTERIFPTPNSLVVHSRWWADPHLRSKPNHRSLSKPHGPCAPQQLPVYTGLAPPSTSSEGLITGRSCRYLGDAPAAHAYLIDTTARRVTHVK